MTGGVKSECLSVEFGNCKPSGFPNHWRTTNSGLCFSRDYKKLDVTDTGASHYPKAPKNIKVWDVNGAKLSNGREHISMKMELNGVAVAGLADGRPRLEFS